MEQPRYLDQLSPEDENNWQAIVRLVQESNEITGVKMEEIWLNKELPQAYRDRAMLVMVGDWAVKKALGFQSLRASYGSLAASIAERCADKAAWLREAFDYQAETGIQLFNPNYFLNRAVNYFETSNIDQDRFEEILGGIDIVKAQPQSLRDDPEYDLPRVRFPLIHDILFNQIGDSEPDKLKSWAKNRLWDWLEDQHPRWLAGTQFNTWAAQQSFRLFFEQKLRDDSFLDWQYFVKAVDILGLEALDKRFSDEYLHLDEDLYYDVQFIQKIKLPEIQKSAVVRAVQITQQLRATPPPVDINLTRYKIRYRGYVPDCYNFLKEVRDSYDSVSAEYKLLDNELAYARQRQIDEEVEREQKKMSNQKAEQLRQAENQRRQAASSQLTELLKSIGGTTE